ncbi:CPBP family intramembrane glutamic endopeptidase [Butyrivibrio sp. MC2021]|uniref:CPBP family intramembrane glutamic endopeptidase n=1 Tax=Butyrivibrio sp. MC2021 TaxID=1408306 RepID=UPI000ACBBF9F|nr:type II CAAX endopeptidase family protein [Butyrivibrio sp. MC2021]
MKKLLSKIHNEGFRWNDIIIFPFLAAYLILEFGGLLGYIPFMIFAGDPTKYTGLFNTLSMYLSFAGIWIVALLWFLLKTNRPIYKAIGPKVKGNTLAMFGIGLLAGGGLNGLCALGAWLHKDIYLYFDSFRPVWLILIFIAVLIQSSAEELICRGFIYQRLRRSFKNPWVAIVGNSIFFGLIHLGNKGVTWLAILDICLSGLLFSFMVYYYDSIWCAFAAHTAWNYMQNIVLGLPNSGSVASFSIFRLDASTALDSFFYNVAFGVEGTVFSVLVLIIACAVTFYFGNKKKERDTNIWPKKVAPAEPQQIQENV